MKSNRILSFFDKLSFDFKEFFTQKIKEIETEVNSINCPVTLSNLISLSNSTVLQDQPSVEFVGLKILKREQRTALIYRASRDGQTPQDFHAHCDLKGPTLLLAKAGSHVFGGYTEASWTFEQIGLQKACSKSFLFSVNNKQKYSIKPDHSSSAIYCRYNCGPVFGKGGYDLFICSGSMSSNGSTPCSYGLELENFSHFSLGGSRDFNLDDFEVYQVIERKTT